MIEVDCACDFVRGFVWGDVWSASPLAPLSALKVGLITSNSLVYTALLYPIAFSRPGMVS